MSINSETHENIRQAVREGYAKVALGSATSASEAVQKATGCCSTKSAPSKQDGVAGGCCGPGTLDAQALAQAIGYGESDLATMPEGANMGLSCGNPTAIASLKEGEVVLDLGSGGGFDCFVAGPKVGPSGRVIGVDMTPEMVQKSRRNLEAYRKQSGLNNVEFRLGEIEHLPVADNCVDVVISNCVLNLSPDKPQVWREIARVLKAGGRVAVSDLALRKPLPNQVREMVEALVGCIAGAVLIQDIDQAARDAALSDITITPKHAYIDAMTDWHDPLYAKIIQSLPAGAKPSDYITSVDISARKRL